MNKRILLAVASVGLLIGQAHAHQLAFSKAEQVSVNVPGEANAWCQPAVELTLERPTWESREPLDRLLSKIPFVLSQECPSAKFTWKAVDAEGKLYASGEGSAKNLGLVNLVVPISAEVAVAKVEASSPAPTPEVTEQKVAPVVEQAPIQAEAQVVATATPAESTAQPQQAAEVTTVAPEAPAAEAPVAVVDIAQGPKSGDQLGRGLVLAHDYYVPVKDQNGCQWMLYGQEVQLNPDNFNVVSEGAACVEGYVKGEFKSAQLMRNDGRRGYSLKNGYVHPSGIIMSAKVGKYMDNLPLAYIKTDASQVVFEVGEMKDPDIKIHLAYQRRSTDSALYAYSSSPYYVGLTADESFAYDAVRAEEVAHKIRAMALTHYRGEDPQRSLYITKDLPALYPVGYGVRNSDHMVFSALVDDDRFRMADNHALDRKQQREREELAKLEYEAEVQARMLSDYEQAVERQKTSGKSEVDYVAANSGYIYRVPAPIDLMNPKKSMRFQKLVAKVDGKDGDYYVTSYPGKMRLSSSVELEDGWQILGVVNTTFIDKGDEKVITPTFMVVPNVDAPKPCEQEKCADQLTIASLITKDWRRSSNVVLEWDSWTPDAAKAAVERFTQLKAAQENQ